MSSQQRPIPQDGAKLIWRAVVAAWFAGLVSATAIWQVLMDLKLGPGQGHWLPSWFSWVVGFFGAAFLTLAAYFLTRAALRNR